MEDEYQIVQVPKVEDSIWEIIGGGINEFNEQHGGPENAQRICYVVRGPDGQVAGGVIALTYWDWLYIDLMWLPEGLRGQGFGRKLLSLVEETARQRGAKHAYLDTFSFQAPGFYEKQGYHVFGELPDFPAGQQRYFMTKQL